MTVMASHGIAADVRSALKRELPWVADVLVVGSQNVGTLS